LSWPPDSDLINRAQKGSVDALQTLIEACQDRLYRFLISHCQRKEDAEDALQETWLNVQRYLYSYNPKWRFSTWLFRIALRTIRHSQQNVTHLVETNAISTEKGPLEQCLELDHKRNLWLLAQDCLNPDQFSTLWLYYAEDLDTGEIAIALERNKAWVKVVLFRARRILQQALKAQTLFHSSQPSNTQIKS